MKCDLIQIKGHILYVQFFILPARVQHCCCDSRNIRSYLVANNVVHGAQHLQKLEIILMVNSRSNHFEASVLAHEMAMPSAISQAHYLSLLIPTPEIKV